MKVNNVVMNTLNSITLLQGVSGEVIISHDSVKI